MAGIEFAAHAPARLLLIAILLLAACGEPVATPEPVYLEAAGSIEALPLVETLIGAFEEQAPDVSIAANGGGSRFGLEALRAGTVDLAFVSWRPEDLVSEADPAWRATAFARDGLAVVVHPDNPVVGLGLLQLGDIFSGRTGDWSALGGEGIEGEVRPVVREEESGARVAFDALVVPEGGVTPRALVAPSPEAVLAYVAADPHAIGYLSMAHVTPAVKVIEVEGTLPTPESAAAGSYPLTRAWWMVTVSSGNGGQPATGAVRRFLDFVLSPAGQAIVGRSYGRLR